MSHCSFANNDGLCGVGLTPCVQASKGKSAALRVILFVVVLVVVLVSGSGFIGWKRRSNMARAQKLGKSIQIMAQVCDFYFHTRTINQ